MSLKYFIGVDVGTQGTRCGVFDQFGREISMSNIKNHIDYYLDGRVEQDANDVISCLIQSIKTSLAKANINSKDIIGISVDSTCSSIVLCSADGIPYAPIMMWMDNRASGEAKIINETLKGHPILDYSGGSVDPDWMIPKALWIKQNLPDLYRRSDYIVEVTNWILFLLTSKWTVSVSNATDAWNFVSDLGGWDRSFFSSIGLEDIIDKWPQDIQLVGKRIGKLNSFASEKLGLHSNVCVGQGGVDALIAMLGLGVNASGKVAMSCGTSNVQATIINHPIFLDSMWGPYKDIVYENKYVLVGGQSSTGSIINRFIQLFCSKEEQIRSGIFTLLDKEADKIPIGSDGLILLDSFNGNRTPYKNPNATGAIFGLRLNHTRSHIYRSILEGIAFGTKLIIEILEENNIELSEVRITGGATNSSLWLQIFSDVCDLPFVVMDNSNAACLGSAIVASVASGYYDSLEIASEKMTKVKHTIYPDNDAVYKYNNIYKNYKKVNELLNNDVYRR